MRAAQKEGTMHMLPLHCDSNSFLLELFLSPTYTS